MNFNKKSVYLSAENDPITFEKIPIITQVSLSRELKVRSFSVASC